MADQPAPGREDPLGGQHPVHVLGRGLAAHQHDLLPALGGGRGVVGGEVHLTDGGAGAGAQALGQRVARPANWGCSTESRWSSVMRDDGLGLGDPEVARAHHVHRHLQRGGAGALAHRVWSIQSLPCSMVNSVSHMSR